MYTYAHIVTLSEAL